MATIRDVANAANVSTATVSRVINRAGNVLPETVARVEAAIQALGFEVKGNRRLTINQGGDMLGLVVSRFHSPFYGLLMQGVDKVARQHGRTLLVASSDYDAESEESAVAFLLSKGCHHIVLHSKALSDAALLTLAERAPGLVLVNRRVKGMASRCVWVDNQHGTYLATRHLIEQGHRRIGYISCELAVDDKADRLAGYQQALTEAGIVPDPDWIEEAPFGEAGGATAAHNLLNKGLPVTALVAFNDFFAAAAMQVFREHGIAIPGDLSVVGFDDVLPECYFSPPLTTIRNPIESMGMNAARLTLERGTKPPLQAFQPLLVKRSSVSTPR